MFNKESDMSKIKVGDTIVHAWYSDNFSKFNKGDTHYKVVKVERGKTEFGDTNFYHTESGSIFSDMSCVKVELPREITLAYWSGKVGDLGFEHGDKVEYSREKMDEIVNKTIEGGYSLMILPKLEGYVVYVGKGKLSQK